MKSLLRIVFGVLVGIGFLAGLAFLGRQFPTAAGQIWFMLLGLGSGGLLVWLAARDLRLGVTGRRFTRYERCYQSEHGHAPTGLEQLVLEYFQHVPQDPFSGRPVIYRSQGTDWLVYSIGEDDVDDGGKRVGRSVSGTVTRGDLFYDSPY